MEPIPLPEINDQLCDGCGQCVTICPEQVLVLVDSRPRLTSVDGCAYCGDCEQVCPPGAIALSYEIVIGEA